MAQIPKTVEWVFRGPASQIHAPNSAPIIESPLGIPYTLPTCSNLPSSQEQVQGR
eukprot:CAMPEP_0184328762 /NCGR_PEP_ID=MMETSP1049-20130417/143793_1 /TAXON_ID=77928 /ORGANISM="Proteomonas sulcata, Strain CCMP704" /LENGTH=54 /DNA_ID=CAMNT_0026651091 /DNA_START=879 /DNA_END=1040 /DNA_ORIENTATION=-